MNEDILLGLKLAITNTEQELTNEIDSLVTAAQKKAKAVQLDLNIDEGLKKLEKTLNGKLKGVNFNPELKKFFEAFSSGDIKDIGKAYEEINNKALLLTKTLTDAQLKLMDGWSGEQVNKFVKKIIKANEEIEKAARKQSKYENIPEYVKKTRASENSIKKTLQGKKNKSDEEILDQFERAGLDVSKITKKELSSFTYYEKLLSYQKELIENDKALANPKTQKEADAQIENAQKLIKVTELLGRSRKQLIEIGKKLNQNEDFTIDEVQSIDPNLATKYAQEWNKIVDKAIAEIRRNINSNLAEELEETSSKYLSAKVERNTVAINQQRAKRAKAIAPVDREDVGTIEQYTEVLNGVDNELDDVQEGATAFIRTVDQLGEEFKEVKKYALEYESVLKELEDYQGNYGINELFRNTDNAPQIKELMGYAQRLSSLSEYMDLSDDELDKIDTIYGQIYGEIKNQLISIQNSKDKGLQDRWKKALNSEDKNFVKWLNNFSISVDQMTRKQFEAIDEHEEAIVKKAQETHEHVEEELSKPIKEVVEDTVTGNGEEVAIPISIDAEDIKKQLQETIADFNTKFSDALNNSINEFSDRFSNIDYYQALEPLRRELLNIVQQFKNSLKDLGIENSDLNKLYETLDAWNTSSHISTEDDRERLMLGNIKSGKTSVAVSGSEASISGELQQRLLMEVSKRIDGNISDVFDMWIHSHPLRDFLPNSKTRTTGADIGFSYGDLQSELNHYFEQGIKKMLVTNNGKYSMLDFSKISKEVLEKFISQLAANLEKSGNFSIETDKIFKDGKGKIKDVAINRNAYVKDGVADLDKKSELINNAILETINSSKELKQIIFETGDIADLKIDEVVQDEKNLANQSEELLNILNQIRNILNDMSISGGGNSNLSGIFNIHLIADVDYLIERIQRTLDDHDFKIKVNLASGQSLDESDEGAINTEGFSADRATDSLHALNYEKSENIELNAKLRKNANESAKALANEAEKAEAADKALTELNKRKRANNKLNEEKSEETSKEDSVELDSTVKEEATTLSSLIEPLNNIKAAIAEKNKAFIGEEEVVKEVTTSEFDHLGLVYDMINEIGQAIENLNKKFGNLSLGQLNELIKKFKSNKTNNANIDGIVENLTKLADRLNTLKIDDSGIIDSITRIVDASKQLKDAVKDAERVKEAVDKSGGNKSKKQKERTAKDIFKDQLKYQKQYIDLMNKSFSENGLTPKDAGKLVEVKQHLRDIADEFANIDFNTQEAKNSQDEYNRKINDYIEKVEAENKATEKIQIAGDFESAQSDLKNLSKKIKDIIDKTGKFRKNFRDEVSHAFVDPDSLDSLDKINAKIKEYNELIEKSGRKDSLEGTFLKLQKYQSSIADILSKNTAMPRELQNEFKALQGEINKMIQQGKFVDSDVIKIQQDFEKLNTTLKESGKTGKSFFDTIGNRLKDMNAKFIAQYFSFQDILRYGREIINTIKEIDTALTELRKVSNASDVQLSASFEEASKTAKELGSSITDVVNATSDWSRLGYSIDEANKLAEISTLFVNVGDNVTMEDVNQSLISTLKGFNMEAENAIDIVDKFNEVANNFPIDTAGIGEALQRSAASFNAANTDLSKSIALVTATNSVLQNPESVGTMWKTLSARIRGAKTELQDLGEEQDAYTESTSKLRDLVKGMTGFDIMEDEDTFKDIYDIIIGIGEEWENLTDIEQASLGEALAGKRNSNAFFAVMNNLDMLKEAYETAEHSAGSAQKEQENYMRSIQYSLDSFQASWQKLQADFLDTQLVKNVVNFFTKVIDFLDEIVNTFGSIPVAATGGILGYLLYNKTKDKVSGIKDTTSEVRNLLKSINDLTVANQLNAASEEEKAKASKDAAAAEITETEANTASAESEAVEASTNVASATSEEAETAANIASESSEVAEAAANIASATSEEIETASNIASAASEEAETAANIAAEASEIAETGANIANATSEGIEATTKAVSSAGSATEILKGKFKSLLTIVKNPAFLGVAAAVAAVAIYKKVNTSVADVQATIDKTTNKIKELNSEIEELKRIDNKNLAQQQRLDALNQELEIQKQLLELEEKRKAREEVQFDLEDLFTDDNYTVNMYMEDSYNKDKFRFDNINEEYQKLIDKRDELDKKVANAKTEAEQNAYIEDRLKLDDKLQKSQQNLADQLEYLTEKQSRYQTDIIRLRENLSKLDEGSSAYAKTLENINYRKKYLEEVGSLINSIKQELGKPVSGTDFIKGALDNFDGLEEKLVELYKQEKLSKEEIQALFNGEGTTNNLSNLLTDQIVQALKDAGVEADALYRVIQKIADPDREWKRSTQHDMRETIFGTIYFGDPDEELKKAGIDLENKDHLQAYLDLKTETPEGTYAEWSIETWIHKIQEKINENPLKVNGHLSVSDALGDNSEKLDEYYDTVSKVQEVVGKLQTGDYTQMDLAQWRTEYDLVGESAEDMVKELKDVEEESRKAVIALIDELIEANPNDTELIQSLQLIKENIEGVRKEAEKKMNFNPGIDKLTKFNSALDSLQDSYINFFKEGKQIDPSNLASIREVFGELEEYQDFENAVLSGNGDLDASFDKLVTAYAKANDVLKEVNEENKQYYITALKNNGIVNAQEVVESKLNTDRKRDARKTEELTNLHAALANTNQDLVNKTKDLEKATWQDIAALVAEGGQSGVTAQELALYALKKALAAGIDLANEGDIRYLLTLANAAGVAAGSLAEFAEAKAAIGRIEGELETARKEADGHSSVKVDYLEKDLAKEKKKVKELQASIQEEVNNFEVTPYDFTAFDYDGRTAADASGGGESEETAETFDWIETKIQRLERDITNLGKTADATYKTWAERTVALGQEMEKVNEQISLQETAYNAYMAKAESVGLSAQYKKLVQSGALKIDEITDETLKEQISNYKEWYEKALDAKDKVDDLKQSLADLAKTKFDNISAQFDDLISDIDHGLKYVTAQLESVETIGKIAGKSFYEEQIKAEQQRVNDLTAELGQLQSALAEGLASGAIAYGSQMFNEMKSSIYSVEESILDANNAILKFEQNIKDVAKQNFDDLISQFENAISILTGKIDLTDKIVSMVQNTGHVASKAYYQAMIDGQDQNIKNLKKKESELTKVFEEAVANGDIEEYSENWYSMKNSIESVKGEILDAASALIEYKNAMRQIDWDLFDRGQTRLEQLVSESQFLIDLYGKYPLFDKETGNITDKGMATRGLLVQNYETYISQARQLQEEIAKLKEELKADPGSTTLIDRIKELEQAERDAILSSEGVKESLRDLLENEINALLEALQKLVDQYKKSLQAQKD